MRTANFIMYSQADIESLSDSQSSQLIETLDCEARGDREASLRYRKNAPAQYWEAVAEAMTKEAQIAFLFAEKARSKQAAKACA